MFSFMRIAPSNIQESVDVAEQSYQPVNLDPIKHQFVSDLLEHDAVSTNRKDLESLLSLTKEQSNSIGENHVSENILDFQGEKLESLINEMLTSYDGDA